MAKSNQTANEAQLKARRTSLGKKSSEELINIILRKDKTERSQSAKIDALVKLLNEANKLNKDKDIRLAGYQQDMNGMEEGIKTKQEQINNLLVIKKDLEESKIGYEELIKKLNKLCNIRKNAILILLGISTILILILFIAFG